MVDDLVFFLFASSWREMREEGDVVLTSKGFFLMHKDLTILYYYNRVFL